MKRKAAVLHGIPNCDTVKRARAWIADQGVEHEFHDFKKAGVPEGRLAAWLASAGWETLLNRKGTTWRALDEATKAGVVDAETSIAVMTANPSTIKRPVVTRGKQIIVGVDIAALAQLVA